MNGTNAKRYFFVGNTKETVGFPMIALKPEKTEGNGSNYTGFAFQARRQFSPGGDQTSGKFSRHLMTQDEGKGLNSLATVGAVDEKSPSKIKVNPPIPQDSDGKNQKFKHHWYELKDGRDVIINKNRALKVTQDFPLSQGVLVIEKKEGVWQTKDGAALDNGKYSFVSMPDGEIRVKPEISGSNDHASISSRCFYVRYAGTVTFDEGAVSTWDAASGTYAPPPALKRQAGFELDKFYLGDAKGLAAIEEARGTASVPDFEPRSSSSET